jgi:Kelch motif
VAGTWQSLKHQPSFCASTMLLLTDGSVMCQQKNGRQWWKLTPDRFGSYVRGSWSRLASMRLPRMYYASAVLADGRVFVAGGEYSGGGDEVELNSAEMYDPLTDTWSDLPTPEGWEEIGDAAACMLEDGRIIVGNLQNQETAIFTPGPDTWSTGPDKDGRSNEESWALLRDGTVLTVECFGGQKAEKYVPSSNTWTPANTTPAMLVEAASNEIGPLVLLTDGRCFAVGATGKTALYTQPANASNPGAWSLGPDFPSMNGNPFGAKDAPGALLPNGNVLLAVAPVDGVKDDYLTPTSFFEFDGTTLNRVPDPPNNGGAPYDGRLLVIPSGQVLFSAGTPEIYVYTPDAGPQKDWRPSIDCPKTVTAGSTFTLFGQQLNGMSQASMYGDDAQSATNYPLVRITTASGRVVFCRTSNHSTMGVATGAATVQTSVAVPAGIENGPAELVVVTNGIASEPCKTTVDGGRPAARGRSKFRLVASSPMAEPKSANATRGIWGTIGLGLRFVVCGFYYACNWAAQLTCAETETKGYAECTKTRDDGYNQCTQEADNGYNQCTQTRDDGYSQCTQTRDDGYNQCCTWWPCSWACSAWVWVSNIVCVAWTWVSNIVCVAWTWISNVVCVAWTWISNVVCVAWTWIVATLCKAFVWVMKLVCG